MGDGDGPTGLTPPVPLHASYKIASCSWYNERVPRGLLNLLTGLSLLPCVAVATSCAKNRSAETSADDANRLVQVRNGSGLADCVGKRIRVIGSAVDTKNSAAIEGEDFLIRVEGLDSWRGVIRVQDQIDIVGVLGRRHVEAASVDEHGVLPQWFPTAQDIYWLNQGTWHVVH